MPASKDPCMVPHTFFFEGVCLGVGGSAAIPKPLQIFQILMHCANSYEYI